MKIEEMRGRTRNVELKMNGNDWRRNGDMVTKMKVVWIMIIPEETIFNI
jgi:hypothetical protein